MKCRLGIYWLVLIAFLLPTRVVAEDIDLFVGRSTSDTDLPNILIVLDNTANWGPEDRWLEQKAALREAFDVIEDKYLDRINLGLMLYTEPGGKSDTTGNANSNTSGAYVRSAVRKMNQDGLDALRKLITGYDPDVPGSDPNDPDGGLDEGEDKGSGAKAGLAMAEAYLYFWGGSGTWEKPYAGNYKIKADFEGNVSQNAADPNDASCCQDSWDSWALPGNALDDFDSPQYNSPVDPDSCGGNYIIFIGNGPASDNSSDKEKSLEILANMEGVSDIALNDIELTTASGDRFQSSLYNVLADEWAYFMLNDSPLEIQTYVLDVNIVQNEGQCDNSAAESWSAVAKSMSTKIPDKQTYFRQCGTSFKRGKFKEDFIGAVGGILSRNSVFASVALPAAANEQSTFLNLVYIGLFRPDPNASPRWYGNLKQYKIGVVVDSDTLEESLQIVDATGAALVETNPLADNVGFVKGCALSYWTPDSENSYWDYLNRDEPDINDPVKNCSRDPDDVSPKDTPAVSDYFDGQIVEKGGQAYTLRQSTPASRAGSVWTCDPDIAKCDKATGLKKFVTLDPNVLDPNDVNWAIGYDVDDEDQNGIKNEMRPSVHGDIVHSQPVARDYAGDITAPEVVVFYGGNDGMLRAINGNRDSAHSDELGVGAGHEFWAFMPPEFYGEINRIRVNTDTIKFPASGPTEGQGSPGPDPKGYGMDGPLSLYQFDLDGGDDESILFAGMRRAGRTIYSFDVTSKTSPKLNWKIGCPSLDPNDPTGCTANMAEIGQTWSRTAVTYAEGYDPDNDGELDPLLIFGGGYDICEDYDDGTGKNNNCATTKGNVIYLLDAVTGNYVHSFSTERSVPGKITVVPMADDDPRIMYAYAADTGGNIYRISGGILDGGPGSDDYAPDVIGSTLPTAWIITTVASLGCDTVAPCDDNRKFLFGPDVIRIPDSDLFGILAGSGDREKPLRDFGTTLDVKNHFYSIIDQPTNKNWLNDEDADGQPICGTDIICHDALATLDPNDLVDGVAPTVKGWKLQLRSGEQVVTGAITVDNVVNFSTHIPTVPESCDADYGVATAYNLNYENASGEDTEFLGGGLVPTPVAGKVIIDGVRVPFCIGCGAEGSPIGVGKVGGGITWTQPRSRVFWNIDQVDE